MAVKHDYAELSDGARSVGDQFHHSKSDIRYQHEPHLGAALGSR
jgi:hypothetical protein